MYHGAHKAEYIYICNTKIIRVQDDHISHGLCTLFKQNASINNIHSLTVANFQLKRRVEDKVHIEIGIVCGKQITTKQETYTVFGKKEAIAHFFIFMF